MPSLQSSLLVKSGESVVGMHLSEGFLLQSLLSSTSAASIDSGNKEGDTQTTNSLSEGPSPLLIAQEYSDPVVVQAAKVCTVALLPVNHRHFSVILHPWASSGCHLQVLE